MLPTIPSDTVYKNQSISDAYYLSKKRDEKGYKLLKYKTLNLPIFKNWNQIQKPQKVELTERVYLSKDKTHVLVYKSARHVDRLPSSSQYRMFDLIDNYLVISYEYFPVPSSIKKLPKAFDIIKKYKLPKINVNKIKK